MNWAYKRARELARRMACYRGEAPNHPHIDKASPNACLARDGPVAINAPDLVYTEDEDKAIDEYTRESGTLYVGDRHTLFDLDHIQWGLRGTQ